MSLTTTRNRKATALPRITGDNSPWVRPSAWLALPDISATNNRFVGLLRIEPESNFVALACTVTGGYTVEWGDGTTTNHASTAIAYKQYAYADIADTGESSLGHRQAIVTVYPQTAGQNITAITLQHRHNQAGLNGSHLLPWLDVSVNASAATSIAIGGNITLAYLQQVTIFSHALTSCQAMFQRCAALRNVPLFNTAAVSNMTNMFNLCTRLTAVPLFNTAACTNMTSMFASCPSLTTVPLFNTAAVANMSTMFQSCPSLTAVPAFNTASCTNMTGMFSGCTSLTTVPLFNTAAVTSMSSMFGTCSSLQAVPAFSTAACTNMSGMFTSCSSLQTVPAFNTASCTNMSTMFSGCASLTTVPALNTAACTNMTSMFSGCNSLAALPALNTSAVTAGNFTTMFSNCFSLCAAPLAGTNQSISYSGCKLSAAALNAIYTALSANGAGKTITVTGNWGTAAHTPTIATAKGWTVTV